jgi:hypothetical protein
VIRVDVAWFSVEALDMRAGVDTALARVVSVFGPGASTQRLCLRQQTGDADEGADT